MASLIVISGKQTGEFLPLGQRTSVIGRAESLPLQILDDMVSRKHLQISYDKDAYYALDMRSKHGVFINSRRISSETILADGDQILIGQTTLLFADKDFQDRESAMSHFKKVGERMRPTQIE
jgi:pSer/pThr/pTyr-binding forkhead associated (FHA) protein